MDGPRSPVLDAAGPDRLAARLDALGPRPAGSWAERRAALLLAEALGAGGRAVTVEPAWVRPRWELGVALTVLLGVVGSVVAVSAAAVGFGLAVAGLVALLLDARGWSPLRWVVPSRATQNVMAVGGTNDRIEGGVGEGGEGEVPGHGSRVRVLLVAHCDTPRGGLPRARVLRRLAGSRLTLGIGPLGWVALALVGVAVCAAVRVDGGSGAALGAVQLVPTLLLIAALGVLVDGALAAPAATRDATGAVVAVELARALDASPPRRVAVDVVIGGAGEARAAGFLACLRSRKLPREATVVVEVSACRAGAPCWWTSDGALVPLRCDPRLAALAAQVAAEERHLRAAPRRGRGVGAALRARLRRLPAIRIGCDGDAAAPPDPAAAEAAVEFGLALVHALDAELAAAGKTRRT